MSFLAPWIYTPFAQALGWTLLHFVWEGAVLALMLALGLWLLRPAPARYRYALACTVLAIMPLVFAATLAVMWSQQPALVPVSTMPASVQLVPVATPAIAVTVAPPPRFSIEGILDRLAWLVPIWLAGVACFYIRGLAGWFAVQRMRRRGVCSPAPEWQARLDDLAARLRLSTPVVLLESCLTDAPVLIGYLRPVVLLPLGCLTGLSTSQVECILLHELAHVWRHDYVVNLLQSVVEGLLFYHPAVWWASRMVRTERENCCDDAVVAIMGDARSYAATLAALEQRRAPQAALAANGGSLIKRIRRLTVEQGPAQTPVAPGASAAALLVVFAAGLLALPAKPSAPTRLRTTTPSGVALARASNPQDQSVTVATPYRKWLHEDVAYIITDAERSEFQQLATDDQREAFVEQFWERRDPTPGTLENEFKEEHYRRIAYANQHFASAIPGWKTDRGRIYITYGPPDEIEDHSFGGSYRRLPEEGGGETTTHPFQRWRYQFLDGVGTNVIIEFVDSDRSGEFHMTMDPTEKEALLAAPAAALAPLAARPQSAAAAAQSSRTLATPYRKWLTEDVAYIVTDEERATFLQLPTDSDRENFIQQFWQRRDPTPGTAVNQFKEEHYRRIAYTNEHFATGIPGWKTDRGRIYIVYGPPNNILDSASPRKQTWIYNFIEGIGNDVHIEFVDPNGDGEYRQVVEPGKVVPGLPLPGQLAKVFVAQGDPMVSVSVPRHGAAAGGVIGAGDVLDITFYTGRQPAEGPVPRDVADLERQIAQKKVHRQVLLQKYRPEFPEVRVLEQQIGDLEVQRDALLREDDAAKQTRQLQRQKDERNRLLASITTSQAAFADKQKQAMQASKELKDAQDRAAANPSNSDSAREVQARTTAMAAIRDEISRIKLQISLYEISLQGNTVNQSAAASKYVRQVENHATVRADGKISVSPAGEIAAAGLTLVQLEESLDRELGRAYLVQPQSRIRVEQTEESPGRMVTVTVMVPVSASPDAVRVMGSISATQHPTVYFQADALGQSSVAKSVSLSPGSYRLRVMVRNEKSGALKTSELDFTVD